MIEPRCDLHGPYTPEQAAALVMGTWKPTPSGYLCSRCRQDVSAQAQAMADRIDRDALTHAYELLKTRSV